MSQKMRKVPGVQAVGIASHPTQGCDESQILHFGREPH